MNRTVMKEVKRAYNESTRQLDFLSSAPVSIEDGVKIMAAALECGEDQEGYNNFKPNLLRKLPEGSMVTLAREGSVCVYVTLPVDYVIDNLESFRDKMDADEISWQANDTKMLRLWWD